MSSKIRVLVVDDAVVMRRIISDVIASDASLELAGVAANGRIALQKIAQVTPDIVTMDVEMPEMDGVVTVREIRKTHPKLPVIMFSTLTQRGAETTIDALSAGATDYVTKPANVGSVGESINRLRADLIPRIKLHCRRGASPVVLPVKAPVAAAPAAVAHPPRPAGVQSVEVLCIGSSTGGPNALADVVTSMAKPLAVPVFVVQHMPPVFTRILAERLEKTSGFPCHEAKEGQEILPGHLYLAPGGFHLEVVRDGAKLRARLHEGAPENSCRPAVDVLFRSVAQHYGTGALAVVLTGMGQDGLRGSEAIRERGGRVIAQDEASSVVWGMPGHVVTAGLADAVLPLANIGPELSRRLMLRGGRNGSQGSPCH
jgi:two-component system chemotaxis response regulator CheB